MQLAWGNYKHAEGECQYSWMQEAILTDMEDVEGVRVNVSISGQLVGNGISDMNTKVVNLLTAYSDSNRNFRVLNNSGMEVALSIPASATNGGFIVKRPPSFPTNIDAAYVTFLPYVIELEAEIPTAGAGTLFRFFEERVSQKGGGSRRGWLEPNEGDPIRQLLKQKTVYRYVQAGTAIGLYSEPSPPPPLWPQWLDSDEPELDYVSPKRRRGVQRDFSVSWSYSFTSNQRLSGRPHQLGVNYSG